MTQLDWSVDCRTCGAKADYECTSLVSGCILDVGHATRYHDQRRLDLEIQEQEAEKRDLGDMASLTPHRESKMIVIRDFEGLNHRVSAREVVRISDAPRDARGVNCYVALTDGKVIAAINHPHDIQKCVEEELARSEQKG